MVNMNHDLDSLTTTTRVQMARLIRDFRRVGPLTILVDDGDDATDEVRYYSPWREAAYVCFPALEALAAQREELHARGLRMIARAERELDMPLGHTPPLVDSIASLMGVLMEMRLLT